MTPTTTTQVGYGRDAYFSKKMLVRARPNLVHELWAQIRPIPLNETDTIRHRRYESLSNTVQELDEGVTPNADQLSITDVEFTLGWYGRHVVPTDKLLRTSIENVQAEASEVLGENAGDVLDLVVRDGLHAGTNIVYAGDATDLDEVAAGDVIDEADLDSIILTLKGANTKKVTEFVKPDEGYATTPVRACYVALVHTDLGDQIQALTGFEHSEKYENMGNIFPGELGRYKDIRFVESTQAKIFADAGAGGIDVYSILVFGKNAYGVSELSGNALKMITKGLGSAGTEDPYDQRASIAWKGVKTSGILNDDFILRYLVALV